MFARSTSTTKRIAIVYNADFREAETCSDQEEPPSLEANSQIEKTAQDIAGILTAGGWKTDILGITDTTEELARFLTDGNFDAVFNLVESLGNDSSRESEFPELLERLGVPYTGNSPAPLRLAHAKELTRDRLLNRKIPVARGFVVHKMEDIQGILADQLVYPMFVKPAHSDASIGIDQNSVIRDADALKNRVSRLLQYLSGPVIVEKYLPGREFNVAFFPNPITGIETVREIDFGMYPPGFEPIVTYDCKWIENSPEFAAFSKPLDSTVSSACKAEILRIARAAFLAVDGDSYGRVDLRLDENDRPVVMEVNPNPDIDRHAGLAVGAAEIGMDYPVLVRAIAEEATLKENHERATRFAT
jgi:D-alanine-D-alanine ligase